MDLDEEVQEDGAKKVKAAVVLEQNHDTVDKKAELADRSYGTQ